MGANDTLDWVRAEIEWLETPLAENKPLLGLCLGAQMLARALARGCSATTTNAARSATTRSSPRSPATGCASPHSRERSTNGILTASICQERRTPRNGRGKLPQPGLSIWPTCGRPPVPPGGDLSHDVPLDPSRRRALDSAWALRRPEHLGGWFQHDGRVAAWLEAFLPAWLEGRLAEPAPKAQPALPLLAARAPSIERIGA